MFLQVQKSFLFHSELPLGLTLCWTFLWLRAYWGYLTLSVWPARCQQWPLWWISALQICVLKNQTTLFASYLWPRTPSGKGPPRPRGAWKVPHHREACALSAERGEGVRWLAGRGNVSMLRKTCPFPALWSEALAFQTFHFFNYFINSPLSYINPIKDRWVYFPKVFKLLNCLHLFFSP